MRKPIRRLMAIPLARTAAIKPLSGEPQGH